MEKNIGIYNPWWKNPDFTQGGLKRAIFSKLVDSLKHQYITVLKGPRQCGKSFLIKQVITWLLKNGISADSIFYFLFDDTDLLNYIEEHPKEFLNYLSLKAEKSNRIYVVLDEFQKVKNLNNLVKTLYEAGLSIKFIVLGSSSLLISEKASESLMGRTQTFYLEPFSLGEYIEFKVKEFPVKEVQHATGGFFLNPNRDSFLELESIYKKYHFTLSREIEDLVKYYLLVGGYPQSILSPTADMGFLRLKEIKQAYLEKDIVGLLRIEKIRDFEKLIKLLSLQTCKLLNYAGVQRDLGISFQTLKKFINILESTYITTLCPVYTSSKITSLKKTPKVFFHDIGLRNLFSETYDEIGYQKEKGEIVENFIYAQLLKFNLWELNGFGNILFWRNQFGNEIDFIFSHKKNIIPVEVKLNGILSRGAFEFLNRMDLDNIVVITENKFGIERKLNKNIFNLPLGFFGLGLA